MSQYTIIYKYGNRKRQLIFKIFPQETLAVCENHVAAELNEKEVIELLENATPVGIKKATKKYGMKIFQGKTLKTFWQFKHPYKSKAK